MQKQLGRNNASSLFGVHQIPSDNQIRNLLDPVPPETLFPLMVAIGDELYSQGYLEAFRAINNTFLIALDGTDFFSSEKIYCPCCSQSKLKKWQDPPSPYRGHPDTGRTGPAERDCLGASICSAPGRSRQTGLRTGRRRPLAGAVGRAL